MRSGARVSRSAGSFSPPHKGHVKSALAFYDALSLDELHVIPAGIPPHKIWMGDATPEDRLNMVKLAFSPEKCGGRAVIADDCEIMRDTVRIVPSFGFITAL